MYIFNLLLHMVITPFVGPQNFSQILNLNHLIGLKIELFRTFNTFGFRLELHIQVISFLNLIEILIVGLDLINIQMYSSYLNVKNKK